MKLLARSESLEPSGEIARDSISDEFSRMSTGAEISEKVICVDWLNFQGAGAYIRLDYQVIHFCIYLFINFLFLNQSGHIPEIFRTDPQKELFIA